MGLMRSWFFDSIWADTVDYCLFVGTVGLCFCGFVDAYLVHSGVEMYWRISIFQWVQ